MADEISIVVRAEDNFSGVLGNFGSIITGIESVVNLASQAFGLAKDIIGDFVNSASESEQAVARLDGVLRATGGAAGLTSEQLQNIANGLQDVTRFSDETILNGEAILLTFRNISGEMFERTVPAMVDMAEIFGSVDSAAMQLGKALNDPLTGMGALSRAGITFSEEQKEMIKNFVELGDIASAQNIILSEVEAQVSGLAETMGNTFSGQIEIAKNKLDTIKETIGTAFLPILGDFINKFDEAIPSLQIFAEVIASIISGERGLNVLFSTFEDGSSYIGAFLELLGMSEEKAYALGDAINRLITDFDLSTITSLFSDWASSVDWNQLSNNLADAINNIDWGAVGLEIRTGFINIMNGLGTIVSEIDWSAVLSSLGNALLDVIGGLFGYMDWDLLAIDFMNGFVYIGQQIEAWVNGIKTSMSEWWQGVIDAIQAPFIALGEWFDSQIADLFAWLGINPNEFISQWKEIISSVGDILVAIFTPAAKSANETFNYISDFIEFKIKQAEIFIRNLINTVYETFQEIKNTIINSEAFQVIIDALEYAINWIQIRFGYLRYIGSQIMQGLIDGIGAMAGTLIQSMTDKIQELINKVKLKLGIASASTIFKDIAKNIVQGLIDGWNLLFDTFTNLISSGIGAILDLFAPFLALFGVDVSGIGGSSSGSTGGGSGTQGGSGSTAQTVNNYFYGTVYIGSSLDNANYDCPSPNPLVAASGNQLVITGY